MLVPVHCVLLVKHKPQQHLTKQFPHLTPHISRHTRRTIVPQAASGADASYLEEAGPDGLGPMRYIALYSSHDASQV